MRILETPLTTMDYLGGFKEAFKKCKAHNQEQLDQIIRTWNSNNQNKLRDILSSQQVAVDGQRFMTRRIFKIKK